MTMTMTPEGVKNTVAIIKETQRMQIVFYRF